MKTATRQVLSRHAIRVLGALFALAAMCGPAFAAFENGDVNTDADLYISFHRNNVVRGAEIRLGEIADITSKDKKRGERLEVLVIGRSPAMGYRQRMHPGQLVALLRGLGIDRSNAVIETPGAVIVEREIQKMDIKELSDAIRTAVLSELPFSEKEAVIERMTLPKEVVLNAGELTWDIDVRLPRRGVGHGSFTVEIAVDGTSERRLSGTMHVDREVQVFEALRSIRRGEPIDSSLCKTTVQRLSEVRGQALEESDLDGPLEARRDMKPGEVMTWNTVERRLLVKRGQAVRMVLQSQDGMRIATIGQARDDGAMGDLVEVMNVKSGKRVQAVVAGNRMVRVPF